MKRIVAALALSYLLVGCLKWDTNKKNFANGAAAGRSEEISAGTVPTALRRVTRTQYMTTVKLALGAELTSTAPLPDDPTKDDLIAIATRDSVFSLRDAELYSNAGWDLAGQFTASTDFFAKRFDCACNDMTRACLAKGLVPIGQVLFHGPFTDTEFYLKLFDDVSTNLAKEATTTPAISTNCQSTRAVLAALMGSPRSFYFDSPTAMPVSNLNDTQKKQFGHSLVSQLAYFLWSSPPDSKLLTLAETGTLSDPKVRTTLIRSMVDDARFKAGMRALFDDWLAMQVVEKLANTTNGQAEIAKGALGEYKFLVEKSLESDDFLNTFLTTNLTVLDASLAAVYGVAATATTLPDADRGGFLTRSAFLVRAGPGATSPTKRGHFIRSHLLCEDIPPPPPNLDLTNGVPKTDDKYEIIKARLANDNCKGCHTQLDPLGIGLEGYGPNGQSLAFPNIATYQLTASVAGQAYSGGSELGKLLLKDDKVITCFARNALRIGFGRKETEAEEKVIETAVKNFQSGSNQGLNELIFQILDGSMQAEAGVK